ncbi:PEK protein kinase Hri2 [Schizosaccharomyces cryophilus OY26]|uniref:non-specific serine/threonine protein kinase n=1 Tax=Schizosaccharomyces cryophilus (strain OY26 / ATCC MYA-4695 / CBS 11777 / NBRC 106824 / NRRL Y48691) TaxID=653667 RepID=S9X121_SCHCR|nr:PEK protein kinase Hri2 [Schizosaccharomyces cryophilus OY26]EPY50757.1 PEK protein kinase Hri2 [Schizosaccharomyces cryophilus OY26]
MLYHNSGSLSSSSNTDTLAIDQALSLREDGKLKELSTNRHGRLLFTALLENFCQLYDSDPSRSRRLFTLICQTLKRIGIVDEEYIEELAGIRSTYQSALHHLITQARGVLFEEDQGKQAPLPIERYIPERSYEELQGALQRISASSNPSSSQQHSQPNSFTSDPWLHTKHSRYANDFEELQILGKGGFGAVYRVRNRVDGAEYAMKKIFPTFQQMPYTKIFREIKSLAKLDHPNIVRYYASWLENTSEIVPNVHKPTLSSSRMIQGLESLDISREDSITIANKEDSLYYDDYSNNDSIIFAAEVSGQSDNIYIQKASPEAGETSDSYHDRDSASKYGSSYDDIIEPPGDSSVRYTSTIAPLNCFILYIQMQLCTDDLESYLFRRNSRVSFPLSTIDAQIHIDLFRAILHGVIYIHEIAHLIHRDIKPSNVFLAKSLTVDRGSVPLYSYRDKENNDLDNYTPKLGDFGLVIDNEGKTLESVSFSKDLQHISPMDATQHVGTMTYAAPELLDALASHGNVPVSEAIDVFALGMVLFELLHPFDTAMERASKLRDLRQGVLPDKFIENYVCESSLILWMTARDPSKRPMLSEVLKCNLLPSHVAEVSFEKPEAMFPSQSIGTDNRYLVKIIEENRQLREENILLRNELERLKKK